MNKLMQLVGRLVFWAGWPFIYMVVQGSRRTRVVVVVEQQVLAIRPWLGSGRWYLPGGGIRRREAAERAAVRELHEELSLTVQPQALQPLGIMLVHEDGLKYQMECFGLILPETPRLRVRHSEIAETCWLPLSRLDSAIIQPSLRTGVTAWLELHNLV